MYEMTEMVGLLAMVADDSSGSSAGNERFLRFLGRLHQKTGVPLRLRHVLQIAERGMAALVKLRIIRQAVCAPQKPLTQRAAQCALRGRVEAIRRAMHVKQHALIARTPTQSLLAHSF